MHMQNRKEAAKLIRKATVQDKHHAAILIHEAIHDIANTLTGETENDKILKTLAEYFSQGHNRLSYQNTIAITEEGRIAGIIIAYHGKEADQLDEPIRSHLLKKTGRNIVIDKEADIGDYYIDTVSVYPEFSGKGLGTKLIQAACDVARENGYPTVALNVFRDNSRARKLYERLGFEPVKTIMINREEYDYMVKSV